jgi:hypothetical protein
MKPLDAYWYKWALHCAAGELSLRSVFHRPGARPQRPRRHFNLFSSGRGFMSALPNFIPKAGSPAQNLVPE